MSWDLVSSSAVSQDLRGRGFDKVQVCLTHASRALEVARAGLDNFGSYFT